MMLHVSYTLFHHGSGYRHHFHEENTEKPEMTQQVN